MSVAVGHERVAVAKSPRRAPRIPWASVSTVVILVGLIVADLILQPGLASLTQVGLEVQTALTLVLLGAAQTLVVLVRGIDLSVGGIMVVTNALTAQWVGGHAGAHQWLLLVVVVAGAAMGALNGVLVAYLRFEPFIATLGTWTVFNGVALLILPTDGGTTPPALNDVVVGTVYGIPSSIVVLAGVLVAWWALKGSVLGSRMYAIGADEDRAFLNGVSVRPVKLAVYALAGLFAGLGGIWLAATTSSGTPTAGDAYILTSVAAVVIGGTSLAGGVGGVGLTVMAAFVLTIISDIVNALNLAVWVSVAASAGLMLLVVAVRSLLTRRAELRR